MIPSMTMRKISWCLNRIVDALWRHLKSTWPSWTLPMMTFGNGLVRVSRRRGCGTKTSQLVSTHCTAWCERFHWLENWAQFIRTTVFGPPRSLCCRVRALSPNTSVPLLVTDRRRVWAIILVPHLLTIESIWVRCCIHMVCLRIGHWCWRSLRLNQPFKGLVPRALGGLEVRSASCSPCLECLRRALYRPLDSTPWQITRRTPTGRRIVVPPAWVAIFLSPCPMPIPPYLIRCEPVSWMAPRFMATCHLP